MPQPTPDVPHDRSQEIVVPADALRALLVKMFVRKGMFEAEAEIGADRLVEADLRGIHSHGSRAVHRYLAAMDVGDIDPRGQILTVKETPAVAVLDGGRTLGHVASTRAMQLAIAKARAVGTGTVVVRNSQHFGAAAVYALMAIEAGQVGFATTSTGQATVAAYGSVRPGTANNALAWGAPVRRGAPFVLDMACAVSAWGKVESLGMYGGELPPGWALDADGHPTTDPKAAKILLPAAGARGTGLAFVCSMLSSALAGARMPIHKGRKPEVDGSEHFLLAIDPGVLGDRDAFLDEMQQTVDDLRALPPAPGFDRVRVPGELEWDRTAQWSRDGIPIHRDHAAKLADLAAGMKLEVPW